MEYLSQTRKRKRQYIEIILQIRKTEKRRH